MGDIQESGYIDEIFQWPIAKINHPDIWGYIFKNFLTSGTDQSNLLIASTEYFEPFLEKQKCPLLFGEVVYVLHRHKYLNISNAQLLEIRGWSKWCRESLDRSLQFKNPCYQNLAGMDHDIHDPNHICICRTDRLSIHVIEQRYMNLATQMQNENGPDLSFQFPCANFEYYHPLSVHENTVEKLRYFRHFMSTFGRKIYYFKYNTAVWSGQSTWCTTYALLLEVLELMPNLRTLDIADAGDGSGNGLQECKTVIASQPLPNLNHLELLSVSNLPAVLVNALLHRYEDKLEKLCVEVKKAKHDDMYCPQTNLLSRPSLSQLSIGVMYNEANVRYFFDGNSFRTLKYLTVCIEQGGEDGSSTVFKELCQALPLHFGESSCLRTLNIFIRRGRYMIFCSDREKSQPKFLCGNARLHLVSVKRLYIYVYDVCFTSLDFILGLENLEELVINLIHSLPRNAYQDGEVKFVAFWNRMEDSNVWEKMPKLKRIEVRCNKCTPQIERYEFLRPIGNVVLD